ncbi:MAG: RHS repeat-associated core domain-containing protein, partial [Myxococcota bacterium]
GANRCVFDFEIGINSTEVGANPQVGDFNGDGFADVVSLGAGVEGLSVQFNDGWNFVGMGGTFATSSDERAIATGDFDGDGREEIIVSVPSHASGDLGLFDIDRVWLDHAGVWNRERIVEDFAVHAGIGQARPAGRVGDYSGDGRADLILVGANVEGFSLSGSPFGVIEHVYDGFDSAVDSPTLPEPTLSITYDATWGGAHSDDIQGVAPFGYLKRDLDSTCQSEFIDCRLDNRLVVSSASFKAPGGRVSDGYQYTGYRTERGTGRTAFRSMLEDYSVEVGTVTTRYSKGTSRFFDVLEPGFFDAAQYGMNPGFGELDAVSNFDRVGDNPFESVVEFTRAFESERQYEATRAAPYWTSSIESTETLFDLDLSAEDHVLKVIRSARTNAHGNPEFRTRSSAAGPAAYQGASDELRDDLSLFENPETESTSYLYYSDSDFEDAALLGLAESVSTETISSLCAAVRAGANPAVTALVDDSSGLCPSGSFARNTTRFLDYRNEVATETLALSSGSALRSRRELDDSGNEISLEIRDESSTNNVLVHTTTQFGEDNVFPYAMTNVLGHVELTRFSPFHGELLQSTDINGFVTTYRRDGFGRVVSMEDEQTPADSYSVLRERVVEPGEVRVRMEVSRAGQGRTFMDLDRWGRVLESRAIRFGGTVVRRQEFDERGHLSRFTHPFFEGESPEWFEMEHDSLGRVVSLPLGGINQSFEYDGLITRVRTGSLQPEARVTSSTGETVAAVDQAGVSTLHIPSIYGDALVSVVDGTKITQLSDYWGEWPRKRWDLDTGEEIYTYDSFGNVLSAEDQSGRRTTYRYDVAGRATVINASGPGGAFDSRTLVWDTAPGPSLGRIHKAISDDGHSDSYEFDPKTGLLSREIRQWNPSVWGGGGIIGGDFESSAIAYGYDDLGRANTTQHEVPAGVERQRTEYVYGLDGAIVEASDLDTGEVYWSLQEASPEGWPEVESMGDRLTRFTTYQARSRLTDSTVMGEGISGESPLFQRLEYRYDENQRFEGLSQVSVGNERSLRYVLDEMGRPTDHYEAIGASAETMVGRWRYDRLGNVVESPGVTIERDAPNMRRLSSLNGIPIEYDAAGRIQATDVAALEYDEFGMVSSATGLSTGSSTDHFSYDGHGNLAVQINGEGATRTQYHGSMSSRVLPASGSYYSQGTHFYEISVGGHTVAQVVDEPGRPRETYYVNADQRATTSGLVNASGSASWREYDAYGAVLRDADTDDFSPTQGFGGHINLSSSPSLVHMQARLYDARIGRFLSPDPILGGLTATGTNPYVYGFNRPFENVDPTGLACMTMDHPDMSGQQTSCDSPGGGIVTQYHGTRPSTIESIESMIRIGNRQLRTAHATGNFNQGSGDQGAAGIGVALEGLGLAVVDVGVAMITPDETDYALLGSGIAAAVGDTVLLVGDLYLAGTVVYVAGKGLVRAAGKARNVAKAAKELASKVCLESDTAILTPSGFVTVDELAPGMLVLASNDQGQLAEAIVHTVSVFDSEQTLALTLSSGEVLSVTPSHPFYSTTRGWVDAVELYPGDQLATADVPVQVVSVAWNRQPTQVVHIEVDGEHTYFAGESGLLTHNKWLVDRLKGLLGKKPASVVTGPDGKDLFRIDDGVRRSKSAEIVGKKSIPAQIKRQGQPDELTDIPLENLRSPKSSIPRDSRFLDNNLGPARAGSQPPPIEVVPIRGEIPGHVPIRDVVIQP